MATKRKLGSHFYLWYGQNFTTGTCIISSHGGQTKIQDTFRTPVRAGFYQRRNDALVAGLNTGLSNPIEMMESGSTCEEYILTKFQGSHGGNNESYRDIRRFVDRYNVAVLTVRNRKSYFVCGKCVFRPS